VRFQELTVDEAVERGRELDALLTELSLEA
jgi:hypothetical protein